MYHTSRPNICHGARCAYDRHTLEVQGVPRGRLPFAIVGWTVGEGCYIAAAKDGAIYVLEPLYTADQWLHGVGALRLADSLQAFVLELAHQRGRWWWQ